MHNLKEPVPCQTMETYEYFMNGKITIRRQTFLKVLEGKIGMNLKIDGEHIK